MEVAEDLDDLRAGLGHAPASAQPVRELAHADPAVVHGNRGRVLPVQEDRLGLESQHSQLLGLVGVHLRLCFLLVLRLHIPSLSLGTRKLEHCFLLQLLLGALEICAFSLFLLSQYFGHK